MQHHWCHHSAGPAQLRGEPFCDCGGYGCGSSTTHHLDYGDKSHRDCCPGRVDLCPNQGCQSSVSLASATFSTSTTSAASTTSIIGVGRVMAHGGSPALSSGPGRLTESWSAGTAHWRVSPKGVAGMRVSVTWPILGPSHLSLWATEKDPLGGLKWCGRLQGCVE